jgi:Cysteine-rich CPCC
MSESAHTPEEIERRKQWFDDYMHTLEHRSVVQPKADGVSYRCPCCGYRTLGERGGFEICEVCFWEDDGQDDSDADTVRGGPNGSLSLTQARQNFREFGACDRKSLAHVRKPTQEEL